MTEVSGIKSRHVYPGRKAEAILCFFLIPYDPINEFFSMNAAEYRKRHFPKASHSLVTW